VTALLIKTLTIPGGIAVTKPGLLIDSLDIFVIQACLFLIIGGVFGIAISFWLLKSLHHPQ
jgi:membrane protein DedA with SNARE-associated domain